MRVLITNNRLDFRGGAESFVGDLARGLQARGHQVMAYSSDPGQLPRMLESDGIPVTTDPARLDFRPDIIHGQHHMDVMTALASLPGVPAVYHCHGAVWREVAPKHPRILRYLAMSGTLKKRMMIEANIAGADIDILLNSVDLAKFTMVREIPIRPARVLFYNGHHHSHSSTVEAARQAADKLGMEFQTIGFHFGRMTAHPERTLPDYDIVMASGRSAIDAMACGCAVIVIGRNTAAELVRPQNFQRWREVNFSAAANLPPPSPEAIATQLALFDADEVAEVAQRLRQEADANLMIDQMIATYTMVIGEHQQQAEDPAAEMAAMATYLRKLVPVVKLADAAQREQDFSISKSLALRDLQTQLHRFLTEMDKFP